MFEGPSRRGPRGMLRGTPHPHSWGLSAGTGSGAKGCPGPSAGILGRRAPCCPCGSAPSAGRAHWCLKPRWGRQLVGSSRHGKELSLRNVSSKSRWALCPGRGGLCLGPAAEEAQGNPKRLGVAGRRPPEPQHGAGLRATPAKTQGAGDLHVGSRSGFLLGWSCRLSTGRSRVPFLGSGQAGLRGWRPPPPRAFRGAV